MAVGWSCRHCADSKWKDTKRVRVFNYTFKRRSEKQIYDSVKQWVLDFKAKALISSKGWWDLRFTKESVAVALQLKEHEVSQVLHKLNLEGLVEQPTHQAPHDSTRDNWHGKGGDSAWQGDSYRIILEQHEETNE